MTALTATFIIKQALKFISPRLHNPKLLVNFVTPNRP